ncbi:MAG: PIN domain-containing protein [Lachnospiraceae bacterium]|nr:PIN domain-containing protein [Lachnospiraceae bacterium]
MKHHYLIDYENVHEDGLTGLNTIEEDAIIHIFYSDRARKLDLDSFREGQILQIEALKVPVGKQSLDMQLVSYMGYLMGREKGEGNAYIIVSKDNGYLNSIPFWKQIMRDGTTVEVRPQIRPQTAEDQKTETPLRKETARRERRRGTARQEALRQENAPKQEAVAHQESVLKQENVPKQETASQLPEAVKSEVEHITAPEPKNAPPRQEKNERRSRNRGRGRNRRLEVQETSEAAAPTAENIVVAAEEASTVAEGPATVVEAPASVAEAPSTDDEASASVTETATAVAEAPAPVEEAPSTDDEASAPVTEVPAPAAEVSTTVAESPAPAAEVPVSAKEEPSVMTEASDPTPEKQVSTEEESTASPGMKQRKSRNRRKNPSQEKSLDRSALNTAVMQTLSKANVDAVTTGKISSIVMKYASEKNNKTLTYREIIKALGQKEGLPLYNHIKSLL